MPEQPPLLDESAVLHDHQPFTSPLLLAERGDLLGGQPLVVDDLVELPVSECLGVPLQRMVPVFVDRDDAGSSGRFGAEDSQ